MHGAALLGLLAVVGAGGLLAVLQLPVQELAQDHNRLLDLNGRDRIWLGYLDQFLAAPLFGRGLGAAEHGASYHELPHNEYFRVLVDGGLVGAALYGLAVLAWIWRVLDLIRPGERPFRVGAVSCAWRVRLHRQRADHAGGHAAVFVPRDHADPLREPGAARHPADIARRILGPTGSGSGDIRAVAAGMIAATVGASALAVRARAADRSDDAGLENSSSRSCR